MSKRAEEAALNAYPNVEQPVWVESYPKILFTRHTERNAFIKGYEQAEKDTLNRAILWLKENAEKYIINMTESYPDAPFEARIGGKCWDDLAKAMEEEK